MTAIAEGPGEGFVRTVFGVVRVAPNDVMLKPSLLGIEVKVKK